MVVNKIILGSVAFGVSFSLGLLASQDLGKALLSGIVTVPAAYAGAAITDNRRGKSRSFKDNRTTCELKFKLWNGNKPSSMKS